MKCEDCNAEMIPQSGCWICLNCGYSKCDLKSINYKEFKPYLKNLKSLK